MKYVSEHLSLAETFPPLTPHEALVESSRCLFCYDAPCTHACPTHIDIPRFIKKIETGNLLGSARTILDSNLIGATCARVCPVQELCEGACVLGKDHKPISIGRLQRFAMDYVYDRGLQPVQIAGSTGKKVAVVGSGPAGLSCAGELARRGHSVTVFERRPLAGGLSTYGIIGLREPMEASLAEVRMIEKFGVRIEGGVEVESIEDLKTRFDSVFIGIGLGATQSMGIPGEDRILDGLEYIEQSKLDPGGMRIGRQVAVIGAGNTAIDCATIARRLGAERVIMVYRRTELEMTAYVHEYEFVKKEGVEFRFLAQPVRVEDRGLICLRMELSVEPDASGRRSVRAAEPREEFCIEADQIVKAVGQVKPLTRNLRTNNGYIEVDTDLRTSMTGVYAGGDCIRVKNAASTVMAVQDGKLAAIAIHKELTTNG
jgi:dihydropyrimidine dehydrogenase (NAD+) subunit PreT